MNEPDEPTPYATTRAGYRIRYRLDWRNWMIGYAWEDNLDLDVQRVHTLMLGPCVWVWWHTDSER